MGKIPQGRANLRQVRSWRGPQGRTWGAIEKGGDGPSPLSFDIAWVLILSVRSLVISWLPTSPTWLKLKTMLAVGAALCWKGWFSGAIRPKKEYIKSCENCFAKNVLYLNNKGPSIKWVCFLKFYGPLALWPWLRMSPYSSLNVIYCLIITAWQLLRSFTCIPMQIKPNKRPLRNSLKALLLWEIGHLSSPSRSCLGRFILLQGSQWWGVLCRWSPPAVSHSTWCFPYSSAGRGDRSFIIKKIEAYI